MVTTRSKQNNQNSSLATKTLHLFEKYNNTRNMEQKFLDNYDEYTKNLSFYDNNDFDDINIQEKSLPDTMTVYLKIPAHELVDFDVPESLVPFLQKVCPEFKTWMRIQHKNKISLSFYYFWGSRL